MLTGEIVARCVHGFALSVLFGGALFPFYGVAHLEDVQRIRGWLHVLLFFAAVLVLVSAIFWFALATGAIRGSLSGAADAGYLKALSHLDPRRFWTFRLLLAAGLVVAQFGKLTIRRLSVVAPGALVLLAGIAWTGHAGDDLSRSAIQHIISDILHLVAAGAWIGALFVFAGWLFYPAAKFTKDEVRALHDALARFSGMGTAAVGTLLFSGILLFGLQTISSASVGSYLQVLIVKLAMFAAMLALAGANRFWLTPRLSAPLAGAEGLAKAVDALRLSLVAETALAVLVLVAAAWLSAFPVAGRG